jgi:hypothetical protein
MAHHRAEGGMDENIKATCSGCNRAYEFHPKFVKKSCMFCGGEISLPSDYAPDSGSRRGGKVRRGCPICGRAKDLEAGLAGRVKACWFCSANLLVPEADGPGILSLDPEDPAGDDHPLAPLGQDTSSLSCLIFEIFDRYKAVRRLGARTAAWIPEQLVALCTWENRDQGSGHGSPLGLAFTSEVMWTSIFNAHSALEIPLGPGALRVQIHVNEKDGLGPFSSAALSSAVGLASLAVLGVGWVSGPNPDAEPEPESLFLNIDLTEAAGGTSISYAFENSQGRTAEATGALGKDYFTAFPRRFADAARRLLAFKAAYSAGAPGSLLNYLTKEGLIWQVLRVTGDETYARDFARRFFALVKS